MKNRKMFIVIAVIICVAILVLGISLIGRKDKTDTTPNDTQPTENHTTPTVDKGTTPSQGTEPTDETQIDTNEIRDFPYVIPRTDLVIEQINSYGGIFFEDGSDRLVSNVAAIVLANQGDECIEYVNITMNCGDVQMRFVGSTLDVGEKMIILEADGKAHRDGGYRDCTAEFSSMAELEMSSEKVYVEENGKGGLLVTNLTKENIPCIRIFYKYYMSDVGIYVGGITYTAKVVDLGAGKSIVVTPSHYYAGFSKVVMVKIYETKD